MQKNPPPTERRLIGLATLILAPLGWSAFMVWGEVGGQPGRIAYAALVSLAGAGWAAATVRLWVAHSRGDLSRWLEEARFFRQSGLLIGLGVATLWVGLQMILRLADLAFTVAPSPLIIGTGLAALLDSALLVSLKTRPIEEERQPVEVSPAFARIVKWLRALLTGVALLYLATYLILAAVRLWYPFELEWLEGGSVEQIRRLLAGQPLYVRPSLEFVPYIYTPLYFYLSALVARLTGVGFVPLRLVSISASLGCMAIIFLIVRRETGSPLAAILATCLFAATYRASAAWLDVGRVDSLALLWLLAAIYALRFKGSAWGAALAGALMALAFLTKQTVMIAALPILLYSLIENWRHGLACVGAAVGLAGLSCLALNVAHDGWFAYYIFGLPGQHRLYLPMLYGFWSADIWLTVGIAFTLGVHYLALHLLSKLERGSQAKRDGGEVQPRRRLEIPSYELKCPLKWTGLWRLEAAMTTYSRELFYLAVLLGLLGGSWAGKLNEGGFNNVLLLAYGGLAILFGLSLHRAWQWAEKLPGSQRTITAIFLHGVCLIQFAALAYNPLAQVPTAQDVQAGRSLVATIRGIDGDVLVLFHGYLAAEAGKPAYLNAVALSELTGEFGGQETEAGSEVMAALRQAIRERRFDAIILDSSQAVTRFRLLGELMPLIEQYYVKGPPLLASDDALWPLTGTHSRPDTIYYPVYNSGG